MKISGSIRFIAFVSLFAISALACAPFGLGGSGGSGGGEGSIGDFVWLDVDGDGIQAEAEQGLPGVTVRLLDENAQTQAETQTDNDGGYLFEGVASGTYQVEFIPPEDHDFTLKDVGENDTVDSDARMSDGRTDPFEFDAGSALTWDAGLVQSRSATPIPPTNTPAPTNTPMVLIPNFFITYEHTAPGSYSEIIVQVENLNPEQEISGVVSGPAVDGDGSFSAVADSNGTAKARVRILQYGSYSAEVPDLGLSGSVEVTAGDPQ